MQPFTLYAAISAGLTVSVMLVIRAQFDFSLVILYFAAINVTTFIIYGWDKLIAPSHITRVPKRVLHLLAFFGGSPAALLAQRSFRHKIRKNGFLMVYLLIAIMHIAALYWYLSH